MTFSIDNLKVNTVWIYGCGRRGKQVCDIFMHSGVSVNGFIVSSSVGNPRVYGGVPVYERNEKVPLKDDYIIVTIQGGSGDDIRDSLISLGYRNSYIWNADSLNEFWKSYPHGFEDRKSKKNKCLFILAGYKKFLWSYVFDRVSKYVGDDIDVCICTSGLYDLDIAEWAKKNGWSYLHTDCNSVTIIQNIAYALYNEYEWIYKMDEDIFLTESALDNLYKAYKEAEKTGPYYVSVMAPLIPLNEYGYRYILERYSCLNDFEARYGKTYFGGDGKVVNIPEIAEYMWGKYDELPLIDEMAKEEDKKISICSTRFNIGLILFRRGVWEDMNGFMITGGTDLGYDEEQLCAWCTIFSKPIMVTHSAVVGHFSFGKQEENMKKFMSEYKEKFGI